MILLSHLWLLPWLNFSLISESNQPTASKARLPKPDKLIFKDRVKHPDCHVPAGGLQCHQHSISTWQWRPAHRAQVGHGGTPIWSHREAAWDPHRCTHGRLDSQTLWPSSGSHNVVSGRQIVNSLASVPYKYSFFYWLWWLWLML